MGAERIDIYSIHKTYLTYSSENYDLLLNIIRINVMP